MWTNYELNYIKANENYLEKAILPLSPNKERNYKFCHKLNIALIVLRGEKFRITIHRTRDESYKVAYLALEGGPLDASNISLASFRISDTETMKPEALKEYLIYRNLVEMGFEPTLPIFQTWLKLVYENTDKVEEFK